MTSAESANTPQITWRAVVVADFALLADWLSRPHVHRYWHHDFTPEGVARDFGPGARGEEAGEKAGFRRVGEGDVEPDNPIDPPLHLVSRIDRPSV